MHALSAELSGLSIETVAERRVQVGSAIEFMRADQLHAGDEIFYTLRVRNNTNSMLQEPVIVKAVPRNTQYVAETASGPATAVDYSVDGGRTFATPDQLFVRVESGTLRPASVTDYTHIRWRMRHPLAPGATALLRFRAIFR